MANAINQSQQYHGLKGICSSFTLINTNRFLLTGYENGMNSSAYDLHCTVQLYRHNQKTPNQNASFVSYTIFH